MGERRAKYAMKRFTFITSYRNTILIAVAQARARARAREHEIRVEHDGSLKQPIEKSSYIRFRSARSVSMPRFTVASLSGIERILKLWETHRTFA